MSRFVNNCSFLKYISSLLIGKNVYDAYIWFAIKKKNLFL